MVKRIDVTDLEVNYLVKKVEIEALKLLNCTFNNEINVIFGSNGSGKTTLLRAIAHSIEYNGSIFVDNKNILEFSLKDLNISYLSQNFTLYPHLTIFENIAFPLKNLKFDEKEIYKRVTDLAKIFGLTVCLSRLPKHISLGQQQKVSLARALVKLPDILLLDEPFSNIDLSTKEYLMDILKKVIDKNKILTLYVTHDLKSALKLSNSFFEMEDGKISKKLTRLDIEENYIEIVK